jgi:signal transduction histidine kinase/AraC-like DNA-binding protein
LLFRYQPATDSATLILDRTKESESKKRILQLIPDGNDKMWIVYTDDLILLDMSSGSIVNAAGAGNKSKKIKGAFINGAIPWSRDSFFVYGFSQYWYRKSGQSYIRVQGADKLPRDEVLYAIQHNEELWLDQKGLLLRFNPKTKRAIPYNSLDGWTNEPLELNNVAVKLSDNSIISGFLSDGIGVFHPDSLIKTDRIPPDIWIRGLLVHNKRIPIGKHQAQKEYMRLRHDQNDLTINFSCPSWLQRHHLNFSYKIDEKSANWEPIGKSQSLTLAGLAPGKYEIRIKATNRLGLSSKIPGRINIKISPPWYQSFIAYLLYFLILSFLLFQWNQFLFKRKLEKAQMEKIKEMDEFKSAFFTNITHEFRTPITLILGMAGEIKQNPGKFLDTGLDIIQRNGTRLLQLVNQVMNLSKIDAGQLKPMYQFGDILMFLTTVMESFRKLAYMKNIDFQFTAEIETLRMEFDPEMMEQSLGNLISNAIKYTKDGGRVEVSVRLDAKGSDRYLVIGVEDDGIGIKKEDMERIFDRFYQSKRGSDVSGSGIGLTLAREIAELMGGAITAESTFGKGSVFTLIIPIRKWSENDSDMVYPTDEEGGNADKPLILLVEDHADMRYYVRSILGEKFLLLEAENGIIGMEVAREKIPDLIISDIMLPEMDGLALFHQLREDIQTSHIPFIFLTAKTGMHHKLRTLELGADEYLTKPFSRQELLGRVTHILEQREKLKNYYLEILNQGHLREKNNSVPNGIDQKFLEQLGEIVEKRFADPFFNVSELEKAMNMSHARFYRKIMAVIGINGNAYLRKIRISKAKELLHQNLLSISEIAFECGFNEPSYFSRVFKEETGVSPAEFLR